MLRRKLRRFPDEVTSNVRKVMEASAREIEKDALGNLAAGHQQQTGDLLQSMGYTLSRDGLSFVVGPGAKTAVMVLRRSGTRFGTTVARGKNRGEKIKFSAARKRDLWAMYKGFWLEFGTKGRDGKGAIAPRAFMSTAYEKNRVRIRRAVSRAVNIAIRRAGRV